MERTYLRNQKFLLGLHATQKTSQLSFLLFCSPSFFPSCQFFGNIVKSFFSPIFYYLLPGRRVTKIELITLDTRQPMCFSLLTVIIIHSIRKGTRNNQKLRSKLKEGRRFQSQERENQVDTLKILRKRKGKEVQKKKLIDT